MGERLSRGRVEVQIQVDEGENRQQGLKLDLDLARVYHDLLGQLKNELGLMGDFTVSDLIEFRDIISYEEMDIDLEAFMEGLRRVLLEAGDRLIQMRLAEGQAMAADFEKRLVSMSTWVDEIESLRDRVVAELRLKLEARVKELTGNLDLDPGRLHQEVAYLADRSDITEEIVRLRSHFDQFGQLIQKGGSVGRRLEFLLQEINREVNTIGSKSGDVAITNRVVDLKTELEKLREQVQNVE